MKGPSALVIAGALGVALVASSCGGSDQGGTDSTVSVVATTTIWGDIAGRIADCGGGTVTTLMPVGADPHEYAPSSSDVGDMVGADLVVANGLGLEEGLKSAMDSAEQDGATVIEVAPLLDPMPMAEGAGHDHGHDHGDEGHDDHGDDGHGDDGHGHDHGAGALDPHVWFDATRMARGAELIAARLDEVTGTDAYTDCGKAVAEELRGVDAEVRDILAEVPPGSRVLITDHDAFGYFAAAYDFEVADVVIPSISTLAEPSSEHLAQLVGVIKETGVPAIFGNTARSDQLLETLSAEAGRPVQVVPLYVGSLGPEGSGAQDYPSMMRENATLIANALSQ